MLTERAYEVEQLAPWHPIFGGIFMAEERLLAECQATIRQEGLDLKTLMLLSQSSLQDPHALDWMDNLDYPYLRPYEDIRRELLYLGYDKLVSLIDEVRSRPRWGMPKI